ncbi:MAG TPA: iron ABC transporter permease [Hyphomonadaceae bacterium]|nr:iron ABC transporter permease [Hyphomonadaceae bacterium]HPI48142.1 iron ABC transporter permease [Hyphomonadaceae bacterium]HPN06697.1 iron ABC transporter permease [Hyphomonadaceae bacterium]
MKSPVSYTLLIAGLALLVGLLAFVSMIVGPSTAGTFELFDMMAHGKADTAWMIMREVRLPRTALAMLVGMTLGMAGAALQGFLRNPLADPGVIGVSPAASLGAVLALYTGISTLIPLALPLMGILGALLCALLLQGLARRGGVLTLVLAGVAVSSLCAAMMSLALNLSPNPYAAAEIMFWLMGSVTDRSMDHLLLAGPLMVLGWLLLAASVRALDALSLGEEAAAGLGVNLGRTRMLVITGTAISVGAGTAVTGGIGFIGLVVPHLLRPLVGHTPSRLLLASALGGGALLLAADILVRVVMLGPELKLGVLTALIGAPFFLWLIFRARTELES